MRFLVIALVFVLAAAAQSRAALLTPGLYNDRGKMMYVGVEHELPDPEQNDVFDPATDRVGGTVTGSGLRAACIAREERRIIHASQGRLGASLYYADNKRRATVFLIHGADPETREMGFIIPYFVCNGLNVISYDQRGTGESTGNWFLTGPEQKADDAAAVLDAFSGDRHIDSKRVGVWGFSNGGWTAPIVTLRRPIAFMILKSAPTESVVSNVNYEAVQELRRHNVADSDIRQALEMWHTVEHALFGEASWNDAASSVAAARKHAWFRYSLMPQLPIPPSPSVAAGLRHALGYDPTKTLLRVMTPTLALYGALDRKLDSKDSAIHMRAYLRRAGAKDVTVKTFPNAGHTLVVSKNGYDAEPPERYVAGYPQIMLAWLARRGFTK